MMVGELEANDFLITDNGDDYNIPASMIFASFMVLVNIVIANLLVGLAITEIKTLLLRAETMRLEATTSLMQEFGLLFQIKKLSFFRYIKNSKKQFTRPWKVCVLPNTRKYLNYGYLSKLGFLTSLWTKLFTTNTEELAKDQSYNVYLYNENFPSPLPEMKLAEITMPANIVNNALQILQRRNDEKMMMHQDQNFEEEIHRALSFS